MAHNGCLSLSSRGPLNQAPPFLKGLSAACSPTLCHPKPLHTPPSSRQTTAATLLQPTSMRCTEAAVPGPTGEVSSGTPACSGQCVPAQKVQSLGGHLSAVGGDNSPEGRVHCPLSCSLSFILTSHILPKVLFIRIRHHYSSLCPIHN